MLNLLRLAALAVALTLSAQVAQAQMSPAQRGEIEGIIKDYLLKNPEVLRDALIELEKRSKSEEAERRDAALKELAPKIFNSQHQVVVGNPKGKIELVEFLDYNCGFCRRAMNDLITLIKRNPDLRVVIKEFPVLGPKSVEAAQVAAALHAQFDGPKYWAFHQRMMLARGQIGRQEAMAAAKASGADMTRLEIDLASANVREGIGEVMQIADALNLTGTPSYILGDEIIVGAVGAEQIQGKIDNIRKCGKTAC
ncbi:MAG: DsbA family protein [Alphaproteobacteria bacterium]|nr:DsbA family protein [Alphaproteobacteria bacterium]